MNPMEIILSLGSKLIENLFPDPQAQADAKLKLLELQQNGILTQITSQTDINKAEASNASVWVSGWRPAIGWVCGAGCAWNWILLPLGKFVLEACGVHIALSPADVGDMMPVLMGMLGLGGLRTYEKINGVAAK